MSKEQLPDTKTKRLTLTAVGALEGALIGAVASPVGIAVGAVIGGITAYAAEPLAHGAAEYIRTVGWLAQMDPTYPHTEFHPYAEPQPLPEPPHEPVAG